MKKEFFDELDIELAKRHWEETPIPKNGVEQMELRMTQAKMENRRKQRRWYKAVAGVAAAFAICFVSVNVNGTVAKAMGEIPGVG